MQEGASEDPAGNAIEDLATEADLSDVLQQIEGLLGGHLVLSRQHGIEDQADHVVAGGQQLSQGAAMVAVGQHELLKGNRQIKGRGLRTEVQIQPEGRGDGLRSPGAEEAAQGVTGNAVWNLGALRIGARHEER